ncbi:MAG: thioredoxin family protein [Chloroflexota bacterium]
MFERILISLALIILLLVAYGLFQARHRVRVQKAVRRQVTLAMGQPSLLYFWSDDCAPCVTQAQFLQQLPEQVREQVRVEKIDAEKEREMAATYGVFTLPTTMLVDGQGSVRHVNYGLTDVRKLTGQLESIL